MKNKKLCKAHLLPESFYRFIRFGEDSLFSIPGNETIPYGTTVIGRWDDQILCADCDQGTLGNLDQYAAKIFLNLEFNKHWFQHPEITFFIIKDIDIARIKLFWMSVLWRHAISKHPENAGVYLPEEDLETIREMILQGNPGTPDDFSVVLLYFGYPQVIMALSKSDNDDGWFDYYVCGWHIWIKGTRTQTRNEFRCLFLNPESEARVIVKTIDDTPRLFDIIRNFVKVDKKKANQAHGDYRRRRGISKKNGPTA